MKKLVSIQFETDLVEKLETVAKQNYRSLAAQIRLMVEEYLKEHDIFEENE